MKCIHQITIKCLPYQTKTKIRQQINKQALTNPPHENNTSCCTCHPKAPTFQRKGNMSYFQRDALTKTSPGCRILFASFGLLNNHNDSNSRYYSRLEGICEQRFFKFLFLLGTVDCWRSANKVNSPL